MRAEHSQGEKDLDARSNAAARLEVVQGLQRRTATENLEEALLLQKQAAEFAGAFSQIRRRQPG